jgi:putative transposase
MPFVCVYIHFVCSTKNRVHYLKTETIRTAMWQQIKENGEAKGILLILQMDMRSIVIASFL